MNIDLRSKFVRCIGLIPAAIPAVLVAGLLVTGPAWSDETEQNSEEAEPEVTEGTAVDTIHDALAAGVTGSAAWIDSFFGNEEHEAELNRTQLKLRFDNFVEEDSGYGFNIRASLRLALPNTGKRLIFTASGSPDDDNAIDDTAEDDAQQDYNGTEDANAQVGLDYFVLQNLRNSLSAQGGVRLSSGVAGFTGARYRYLYSINPDWDLRLTQRVRYYTDTRFESVSKAELDRLIFEDFLLRFQTKGTWFEDRDGYFYELNTKLYQPLSNTQVLEYQVINQFVTEPSNRLDETLLRVRYRQSVWREWLTLELAPQLSFPRDRDFKITPGVLFRIETTFGG